MRHRRKPHGGRCGRSFYPERLPLQLLSLGFRRRSLCDLLSSSGHLADLRVAWRLQLWPEIPVISTKKTPCIKCIIQQKSPVITFINGHVIVPESAWTDSNHWLHWPHSLTGKVGVCTHEGLFNCCSYGHDYELQLVISVGLYIL